MADRDGLKPASAYPEAIYLQRTHEDGSEMLYPHDATWTETSDCGYDIKYIRADIASPQPAPHAMPDAGNPALQKLLDSFEIYNGEIVFDYQAMYEVRDALLSQPAAVEPAKPDFYISKDRRYARVIIDDLSDIPESRHGEWRACFFDAAPSPAVAEPAAENLAVFAAQASESHMSALVDHLQKIAHDAIKAMKELHDCMTPNFKTEDIDASIPGGAVAKFVNEHARLKCEFANGPTGDGEKPGEEPARKAIDAQGAINGVRWDLFPAYLIDNVEGQQVTITEEWIQSEVAAMIKHPDYVGALEASPLPAATLGKADNLHDRALDVFVALQADKSIELTCMDGTPNFVAAIEYALAQQPAASDVRDGDMFWLFGDGDQSFNDLESACDTLDVGNGDILEFDCAMRLPNIKVRIDTNLPLGYEIIATHPASSTAAKGDQKP